ncbi:MAG: CopG family antitoxin [bacterium]|nr:CopG family antitoxin [bacterium]
MADKQLDSIPENMTIEEASEFWDTHSVADYPSQEVQLNYAPEGNVRFIAISNDLLREIEKHASAQGVSVETLVNLWIQEKLAV